MRNLKGVLYLLLVLPITLLTLVMATLLAILKLVIPVEKWQWFCTALLLAVAETWAVTCRLFYRWVHAPQWDVQTLQGLTREHWYLLVCNHQSWSDIPILLFVLGRRISVFRFFVKRQLLWVPVVGLACWAMEYPFMRRYRREQLDANPALRSKDQQATQQFCERMQNHPATIVNYLEGTRFTRSKHDRQASPYRHLLKPKSGGVAYVVTHLGERIRELIDVTIVYPQAKGFWAFLCGDLGDVRVRMQRREVPERLKQGDYQNCDVFRDEFQQWIATLWQEKDELIERELGSKPNPR
ncbi:MAG: acyltransferase [Pseudomonadales bacterium]